jgi:hypothetical protein
MNETRPPPRVVTEGEPLERVAVEFSVFYFRGIFEKKLASREIRETLEPVPCSRIRLTES